MCVCMCVYNYRSKAIRFDEIITFACRAVKCTRYDDVDNISLLFAVIIIVVVGEFVFVRPRDVGRNVITLFRKRFPRAT